MKQTLLERLLGTNDTTYIIATLFFAMIGVAIGLLIHFDDRNKTDPTNPTKFSFTFLVKDNWRRILLNFLLILVTIRFCQQITGVQLNEFVALLIGVSYDRLSGFLQKKKILGGKTDNATYVK